MEDNKVKEAKRAYYKKYRESNKEKIKEIQDRYWKKKATALDKQEEEAKEGL